MMKRKRGIIAIFLLLAMLLTACGQSAQTPAVVDEPENTTPVVVEPVQQEDTAAEPLVFSDQPANVFRAKFEGSNVAGKGEAVDGVYRFTATKTDGEAWHVKLESNYMTVPGRDYRVTYHFKSDVAGTVKFGDFHEFAIRKGENTVTGQVSAVNGYTYLDLQLGALMPFTIDFTSIEVDELETEADYENVMTVPIAWSSEGAVYVQHDPGYFYKLDRHVDGVTMKVEEIPFSAEVWMSRLYVKTAAILAPGALYRVSADVSATHEMDMEVCFNNGDNEKGYGAFYGQRMGDMSKRTFQQLIDLRSPGSEGGEVVLQFAFGKSPDGSQVTVDNIRVEKVHEHYTNALPATFAMDGAVLSGVNEIDVPVKYTDVTPEGFTFAGVDSVYERHVDGYRVSLTEEKDSATLKIDNAPDAVREKWMVKLFVDTGVTLQAGKAYLVSADVTGAGVPADADSTEYEICYNKDSLEKGYGELYGLHLTTDAKTVYYTVQGGADADLVLQFGVGKLTTGTSFTVKNVKVQEIMAPQSAQNLMTRPLQANTTVRFLKDPGYTVNGYSDGNTATMEITAAPDGERKPWNAKMMIDTGIVPEAGSRYLIKFDLYSEKAQHIDLLYCGEGGNNGELEKFYGDQYPDLEANSTRTFENWKTITESKGPLTICLSVGMTNDTSGNTFKVSNLKVYQFKPTGEELFTGALTLNSNVFENHYDEMDQFTSAADGAVTLNVTKAKSGGAEWSSILKVQPGVAMVKGKRYRVSVDVASTVDTGSFALLLRKGDANNAENFAGLWGQSLAANGSATLVKEFDYFDGPDTTDVVLRFELGNLPAGAKFTVSNVSIQEVTLDETNNLWKRQLYSFAPVEAWTHDGYSAALTADGGTATLAMNTTPASDVEVWKTKLFVNTGIQMAAGKVYRINADVKSDKIFGYEICYNNGGAEKGVGARYGLETTADYATVTYYGVVNDTADLNLQFSLGNALAESHTSVKNVAVEECGLGENLAADLQYDSVGFLKFDANPDEHYTGTLKKGTDPAVFTAVVGPEAGGESWRMKLHTRTGFIPQAGKSYRVSFDIKAEETQNDIVVFLDGDDGVYHEKAYGEVYGQTLKAKEKKTISVVFSGKPSSGELSIQLQLGTNKATGGNVYEISNLKIEQISYETTTLEQFRQVSELWTHEDYAGTLITTGTSASARLTKTPAQGKEAWKTKLFVETGAKLQAGQKYRITFTVVGSNGMPYEICLNHGGEEKGLGGIFGLSGNPGGEPITYVTTPDKDIDLVLQFSLGNAASGNTLTVRNLRVEKAGASSLVSHTTYTF